MDRSIKEETIALIDTLKAVCQAFGMGSDGNGYKVITQVFLYKFINDKFGCAVKQISRTLAEAVHWETEYEAMTEDERLKLLDQLSPDIPRLYPEHLIYRLWNQQSQGDFDRIFDSTLEDIADKNREIFAAKTTQNTEIPLFEPLTQFVTDPSQRASFARALIETLVHVSFEEIFSEGCDFFAAIFEYLIGDYNTAGGGIYAQYYTPHAIAVIMARLLVGENEDLHSVECYDPSAGTGTLLMALAHRIGEDRCTIFSQDISQQSNKLLKLNLILNGLVSSLDRAVQGDTLASPYHRSDDGKELRQFDYVVSNPPFHTDFSGIYESVAAMPSRFWAGVPNIPAKKKESMAIYTCFLQHVINSIKEGGKGAVVVPSGFLTDTGRIQSGIREHLIANRSLSVVIQMPANVFANTNTSVSVVLIDKSRKNETVMLVDASRLGRSEKIDDITKTVFSEADAEEIVNAVVHRQKIPEFSVEVKIEDIEKYENMIKPGLYFEMRYPVLRAYVASMDEISEKMRQKKAGLIREMRGAYARNLIIRWFVDFAYPGAPSGRYQTDYGAFPQDIDLIPLQELVADTIGGEWGKDTPEGRYTCEVRCIRGTDIPNIETAYYDGIPTRYVLERHVEGKHLLANDIIVEISGGSPIQSTGRTCFISDDVLKDLKLPLLCTNFCRVIRMKEPQYAEYIYHYIVLLYNRGYFFNLENNTTGIKNLIFSAFLQNIKIPVPKDKTLLERFAEELDQYTEQIVF